MSSPSPDAAVSDHDPAPRTRIKRTARMTTSGRAPTKRQVFIDDEAEEDNDVEGDDNDAEEEIRDFIVPDDDDTVTSGSPKTLNTKSYQGSKSDSVVGKKSPFAKFGTAPTDTQRKLEIIQCKKQVSVPASEYEAFLEYRLRIERRSPSLTSPIQLKGKSGISTEPTYVPYPFD
ncbi:hypothetical protein B0H17DRAFT_1218564 [Mycena rosella]|uniref:Uncharacterized protein n=1 Tax=Mycena rosella TaxID=1033263 RepID=A0AAD7FIZ1_MYCRO|nr:hypothetical protein B0H17DRAFT_1218564 [Mycena rosella]